MQPIEYALASICLLYLFRLVTFPGELSVQIGLNSKQATPHEHTFVAGYTNGHIYYAPTTE